MENNPLVTIGMPVRNGEKFINYTLRNIFLNKFPADKYEVVICNHSSTDNSLKIINKFSNKYKNIKVFTIPFEGVNRSKPRNVVLENASGEIIILIDQDILIPDYFIKEHVKIHYKYESCIISGYAFGKVGFDEKSYLEEQNLDLNNITTNYELLKSKSEYIDIREKIGLIKKPFNTDHICIPPDNTPFRVFWTCNLSFRKKDLSETGLFDEDYREWGVEDNDFVYRFQLLKKKMVFSWKAWCYHMVHPVNIDKNRTSWKKNLNYFFNKFANYELEFYFMFGKSYNIIYNTIEHYLKNIEINIKYDLIIDSLIPKLSKNDEKRLGILILNTKTAKKLNLTHCFIPLDNTYLKYNDNGKCAFWSLIGFKTPFKDQHINETIIIFDMLLLLDSYLATLILIEMVRISKKIIIYYSKFIQNDNSYQKDYLEKMIKLLKFNEVVIFK